MNHNRKRREAERKRRDAEERQRARRKKESKDALPVDRAALRPSGSWFPPEFVERGYYLDVPFTCVSCGVEEVWTAAQQKWWYEVAKGSVDSTANRCRACRREMREHKGKADPLHHLHRWIRAIRDDLGPAFVADGWAAVGGTEAATPHELSYERDGSMIRFRWYGSMEAYHLVLDRRGPSDEEFRGVVSRPMFRTRPHELSPPALRRRLAAFLEEVRDELGLESAQSRDGATT